MSPVARGSEDRDRGFSGKVVRSGRRQAGGLPCDRKAGRDSPAKRRVAEPGAWQLSHFGGGAWALSRPQCARAGQWAGCPPVSEGQRPFRPVLVSLPWTSRLSPAPSQPSFRRKRFIRPVLTEQRMLPARGHSGEQTCPRAQSSLCRLRGAGHGGQVRCLCVVREVEGLEPLARRS